MKTSRSPGCRQFRSGWTRRGLSCAGVAAALLLCAACGADDVPDPPPPAEDRAAEAARARDTDLEAQEPAALRAASLDPADVARIERAVVRVVAFQGGQDVASGSGTLVTRHGRIYTNRHVIDGADDFGIEVVENPNEPPVARYRARVVGYSPGNVDFAVLQIDRDDRGQGIVVPELDLPFIPLAAEPMVRGEEVFVFGYPGVAQGHLALTSGIVAGVRNDLMAGRQVAMWYATDTELGMGISGGLAVNQRGEMVGIPTSVASEDRPGSGARLGSILTLSAARATIAEGLRAYTPRGFAGSEFAEPGDTLAPGANPPYGRVELAAGFEPDPYRRADLIAGGPVDARYLGGACSGFVAAEPDIRLDWSGSSQTLVVGFAATENAWDTFGAHKNPRDAALVVRLPSGRWLCNDDGPGLGPRAGRDPMILMQRPEEGPYEIWVATYGLGDRFGGELWISQRRP